MTLAEIYTLLNGVTGFAGKVVYEAWPENEAPELPFICYLETSSDNFGADNKVYYKRKNVQIELYSKRKDGTSEAAIEAALDDAGIFYNSSDVYLDDEKCHERIYEIEV